MNADQFKQAAAQAALDYCLAKADTDTVIGIGTGSTVNHFIRLLAPHRGRIGATVASSEASAALLREHHIPVADLNAVDEVAIYVDGADEINRELEMIKGGGGALTREKILAAVAREFVCIADQSKWVDHLGRFPLPVEVIPMARSHVGRQLRALGANPAWRQGTITDNGNYLIDAHDLYPIAPARALEERLNNIPGVVCNGLFALRPADLLLLARDSGVESIRPRPH